MTRARLFRNQLNTWAATQRDQPLTKGQTVITPDGTTGPITGTTRDPYGHTHRVNGTWWRAQDLTPIAKEET